MTQEHRLSRAGASEHDHGLTAGDRQLDTPQDLLFTKRLVLALPVLTILADTIALFGGLVMSVVEVGQTRTYYLNHVYSALSLRDIGSGLSKTLFFAFFIGVIACYNGINARGGADGVGKATTNTVVISSISVIISDFFLTKLFMLL